MTCRSMVARVVVDSAPAIENAESEDFAPVTVRTAKTAVTRTHATATTPR